MSKEFTPKNKFESEKENDASTDLSPQTFQDILICANKLVDGKEEIMPQDRYSFWHAIDAISRDTVIGKCTKIKTVDEETGILSTLGVEIYNEAAVQNSHSEKDTIRLGYLFYVAHQSPNGNEGFSNLNLDFQDNATILYNFSSAKKGHDEEKNHDLKEAMEQWGLPITLQEHIRPLPSEEKGVLNEEQGIIVLRKLQQYVNESAGTKHQKPAPHKKGLYDDYEY